MPNHLFPDLVLRQRQFLVRNALRTKLGRLLENNLTVKRERTTEWRVLIPQVSPRKHVLLPWLFHSLFCSP
jgi:hypothetical protein